MKTIRVVAITSGLCLLLAAGPAVAQGSKSEPPDPFTPSGRQACTAIPDDAYNGTVASMTCQTVAVATVGMVDDVDVVLGINHSWVGDLTVKLVSPTGTVSTLMSKPGANELADDGVTPPFGFSSNLIDTSPVTFDDSAGTSAEAMGVTINSAQFVCQDDGICDYFPFPDTGPGTNLDDFDGEAAAGNWMVCVGDSAGADTGEICDNTDVVVTVVAAPTLPWGGMIALVALLGLVSFFMLRRRATA